MTSRTNDFDNQRFDNTQQSGTTAGQAIRHPIDTARAKMSNQGDNYDGRGDNYAPGQGDNYGRGGNYGPGQGQGQTFDPSTTGGYGASGNTGYGNPPLAGEHHHRHHEGPGGTGFAAGTAGNNFDNTGPQSGFQPPAAGYQQGGGFQQDQQRPPRDYQSGFGQQQGDVSYSGAPASQQTGFGAGTGRHHHHDQVNTGYGDTTSANYGTDIGGAAGATTGTGMGEHHRHDQLDNQSGVYDNQQSGYGTGQTGQTGFSGIAAEPRRQKASVGEKVKGEVEEFVGRVTNDPERINAGHALKQGTHPSQTGGAGLYSNR